MLRHLRFLLFLFIMTPVLLGVGPLQEAEGGFTWQWWYWLIIIGLLVFGLLWFVSMVAGRQAPKPEVEPEKYRPTLSDTSAPAPAPKPIAAAPVEPTPAPPPQPAAAPTPPAPASLVTPDPLAVPEPIAEPVSFAPAEPAPEPEPAKPDDLAGKLEGVGPKIQEILYGAGIKTFAQLAGTDVAHLEQILTAAGDRYRLADPTSWPEQARLAAAGDWAGLQTLQDGLKGGRVNEDSNQ
jgi:predicted flap endonuclease-1-like 5' DNA nuclease